MPFSQLFGRIGGRLSSPSLGLPGPQSLAGQVVVFTGKLSSLGRRDARAAVARLGGAAANDVNARTTILVIGDEGFGVAPSKRTATEKSNKLRRAEELNAHRQSDHIRIMSEADFCQLVGVPSPEALKRHYHSTRELLDRYRALREDHVRYLIKCGVIGPVLRTNADTFLGFPDLAIIKQVNDDLAQGTSFQGVVRSLLASRHGQLAFD